MCLARPYSSCLYKYGMHVASTCMLAELQQLTGMGGQAFKSGDVRFLIATDVAARGIDIAGLPYMVNMTLPDRDEDYIHRVGRVGMPFQACTTAHRGILEHSDLLGLLQPKGLGYRVNVCRGLRCNPRPVWCQRRNMCDAARPDPMHTSSPLPPAALKECCRPR